MKKIITYAPFVIFLIICFFSLIYILKDSDPTKPPSALLNKPLPIFTAQSLLNDNDSISQSDLKNNIIVINFFASWCLPCKAEHSLFFKIKNEYPNLFILGINHKDKKNDALKYLEEEGNPYDYIGLDPEGMIALEFGVFGLPETFIVNTDGKIIYKHLGPLTKKIINDEIKSILE